MKFLIALVSLLVGTSAFATTYEYQCFSFYWNGYDNEHGTMTLTVGSQSANADIKEVSWDENLGGEINTQYKSKGSLKFLKFGRNLLLEQDLLIGGKKLRDGKLGGIARVEGHAEGGFYQYKFICKR